MLVSAGLGFEPSMAAVSRRLRLHPGGIATYASLLFCYGEL
jgi:hypothetical protein